MTALLALIGRLLTGLVELLDPRLDDLSYRWGWR